MLKDVMHVRKSPHKSKDLEGLTDRYHELQKSIRHLLVDLKTEHSTMTKYYEARSEVASRIAHLATGSPLVEIAGSSSAEPSVAETQVGESYSAMHKALAAKGTDGAVAFQEHVIHYVTEWDSVITTRIDAGLKKSVALRRDLDHYEHKVEHLKHKKTPDEEKVERNEDKHTIARDAKSRRRYVHITRRNNKQILEGLTSSIGSDGNVGQKISRGENGMHA